MYAHTHCLGSLAGIISIGFAVVFLGVSMDLPWIFYGCVGFSGFRFFMALVYKAKTFFWFLLAFAL